MGSLSRAKTLGGVGSILSLLLIVPYFVGTVLVIVGWIMILLAIKNVSEVVQDRAIYRNALIAAITAIINTAVLAVVVAGAVLGFVGLGGFSSIAASPPPSSFYGLIAGVIAGLVVVWVLAIVSSYFLWKSLREVGSRLGIRLFGTAALLYFIGAILAIILVGFILIFIAQIMFVIAFFSIKDQMPAVAMPAPAPMPT